MNESDGDVNEGTTLRAQGGDGKVVEFLFRNSVNAHPLQYTKARVRAALRYTNEDLLNMTRGLQPGFDFPWLQPTFLSGDPPARGIDVLEEGQRGNLSALQRSGDPANHYWRVLVSEVYPVIEDGTAMEFFFGMESSQKVSEYEITHEIKFDDALPEFGTMQQDQRVLSYYVRTVGCEKRSTGYAIMIPWEYMLKELNYKGQYTVDRMVMNEISGVLRNIVHAQHLTGIELWHHYGDPFALHVQEKNKQYESLGDMMRFYNETFGILNEQVTGGRNAMDELTVKIYNRVRTYNNSFPHGKETGIMLPLDIAWKLIQSEGSSRYSLVGGKTDGLRNKDAESDSDRVWESSKLGGASKIYGIAQFPDSENATGMSPFESRIRMGHMAVFPSFDEVFDPARPHSAHHYDIMACCAQSNSSKFLLEKRNVEYVKVLKMVKDERMKDVLSVGQTIETVVSENTTWDTAEFIGKTIECVMSTIASQTIANSGGWKEFFGIVSAAQDPENYSAEQTSAINLTKKRFNKLYEILFKHIASDDDRKSAINTALSRTIQYLIGKDNLTVDAPADFVDAYKSVLSNQSVPFTVDEWNPFKEACDGGLEKVIEDCTQFNGAIPTREDIVELIENGLIPPFFHLVLLRFEELRSYCVFAGTQDYGRRSHIKPVVTYELNHQQMTGKLTIKMKVGVGTNNTDDGIRVEDTYVKRIEEHALSNDIPTKDNDYYRAMVFPLKVDLGGVDVLFHNGVPPLVLDQLSDRGRALLGSENLDEYIKKQKFDRKQPSSETDYYMSRDKMNHVRASPMCFRGGYVTYNRNTGKFDQERLIGGPMSKLYYNNRSNN